MKKKSNMKRQDERGSALVLTLGILSLVLVMAMSFAFTSRTSRQVARVNSDQVKAQLHASSALERVVALMKIGLIDKTSENYLLYPANEKTGDLKYPAFDFKKHCLNFKEDGLFGHQHIWSYIPDGDKKDDSTDSEVDSSDNVTEHGFTYNKEGHSFYNTLMSECPFFMEQYLRQIEDSSDSKLSSDTEQGTKSKVEDYLKDIGFNTLWIDDKIVGRFGFLVLEEGHKFDVNQLLTLKMDDRTGSGDLPFTVEVDDEYRMAIMTEKWKDSDNNYYYNITGEYKPDDEMNASGEEEGGTERLGLHMQELDAGRSEYFTRLQDSFKKPDDGTGTYCFKVPWMSYDHLWKGMLKSGNKAKDAYESDNSQFKNDFLKYRFFSDEEEEAWLYNDDFAILPRFDVTGYEWRSSSGSYYQTNGHPSPEHSGWMDASTDADIYEFVKTLAFVSDDEGSKNSYDSLLDFSDESKPKAKSIPALAFMKDKDGKSVALQVAANMRDYCDQDDYATICGKESELVYSNDIYKKVKEDGGTLDDDFKIVYCGNEKVAYFNQLAVKFYAQRVFNSETEKFTYRMRINGIGVELANMYKEQTDGTDIPVGDIYVRVEGTYKMEYTGATPTGQLFNDKPEGTFKAVFKATENDTAWNDDGYSTKDFDFELVSGSSDIVYEYTNENPLLITSSTEEGGTTTTPAAPKVSVESFITRVVLMTEKDEKILDLGWWKASDEGVAESEKYKLTYEFPESTTTVSIDNYFYSTMEANDPRCNHKSLGWKWKTVTDNTYGGFAGAPSADDEDIEDKASELGYGWHGKNSNFTPGSGTDLYGDEEAIDKEASDSKICKISTAYIRNAPFETLWELGAIHRGEPFRTINLSVFSENYEEDSFDGKYEDGDAHLLDQVKIGPARYSRGKFNVNSRSEASFDLLYNDDLFSKEDTYEELSETGESLPEVKWTWKDGDEEIPRHWNRGQFVNLIAEDYYEDCDNDAQMESFIGRTANLLSTRSDAYTVIIISQVLEEREELKNAMSGMSDDAKKEMLNANMANPTWYKVYKNSSDSDEHLCEILGTTVIQAHLVRDAFTGEIKVVKKEFMNNY